MRYTIFLLLAAFVFVGGLDTVNAQDMKKPVDKKQTSVKFAGIQKSPTDISYMREGRRGPVHAKVVYSRPFKKDRAIFGALVPYGKVWRTGADETTEITFYKDVMFGGSPVKAGTYALYTVPNQDTWDVMLNLNLHTWGAFAYNEKMNVVKTSAKVQMMDNAVENFSIAFSGGNMIMAWDKTMVAVPIN